MSQQNQGIKALLAQLKPLRKLNEAERLVLARGAKAVVMRGNTRLRADQDRDFLTFVLAGKVELVSERGVLETIAAGSERALEPLFRVHSPHLFALARNDCKLLRFDRQQYQAIAPIERPDPDEKPDLGVVEVIEGEAEEGGAALFRDVFQAFQQERLPLPSLPDIAEKVRRAVDDPFVGINEVAVILQTDPTLSARLIQTANSVFYRGTSPVSNLRDAVNRIGLSATRNITVSFVLKNLFNANLPETKGRMKSLYEHCIKVSALSHVIARRVVGLDPERALLAGLVHDIGLVPVLMYVDQNPHLAQDTAGLDRAMRDLRALAGNMVLSHLGFEPDLIRVAEGAEEWTRDPSPMPDYCDVVIVAQLHSYFGTERAKEVPRVVDLPAFRKLALGDDQELDPKVGLRFLYDAREELRQMQELLRG